MKYPISLLPLLAAIGCHATSRPPAARPDAADPDVDAAVVEPRDADPDRPTPAPEAASPRTEADAPPAPAPEPASDAAPPSAARRMVDALSLASFRQNMREVSAFGDRAEGSPRYDSAAAWLERQLAAAGYTVEHHDYTFQGGPRRNFFVTKVSGQAPDRMYIVASHLDGRGGGGAFDDNGSGVSLVLELARAFAPATVETDVSLRFAFFDNEETGMNGSGAYVKDRAALQGREDPPGSHQFPEPRWLGMIQHDMLLYDHGMPPGPTQSPSADIDIEYQVSSRLAPLSGMLADTFAAGSHTYGRDYPVQIGLNMRGTDSTSFQEFAPSISMRENQRAAEIEQGSNPNHHMPSDVESSYSEADFHLGFTIVRTTMGTMADLVGARLK